MFLASAWRSFPSPDRIRVLTVPSGWFNRAATSTYVNSPKNAVAIAWRSSLHSWRRSSLRLAGGLGGFSLDGKVVSTDLQGLDNRLRGLPT
jgi:hypothetical protein